MSYDTGPLDHLGDNILRAVILSHLHEFRERENLTGRGLSNIRYPLVTQLANGEKVKTFWFEFECEDWRFELEGQVVTDLALIRDTLHNQFREINVLSQALAGRNHPEPLKLHSKIQLFKQGHYFLHAGIVVDNRTPNLRVLVAAGNIISVPQKNTRLLDPANTLPFGLPV